MVRVGRYGPYLQRTLPGADAVDEERGNGATGSSIPEGVAPDELTPEKVDELFLGGGGERKLGEHPETGEPIVLKSGRYGPYVSDAASATSSLLQTQSPDTLTLDEALQAARPCPGWSARTPEGAEIFAGDRPVRAVRQARRRLPVAGRRGQALHGHAGRGAGAAGRAEDPAAPGGRRRRCARWASTRSPRSRW